MVVALTVALVPDEEGTAFFLERAEEGRTRPQRYERPGNYVCIDPLFSLDGKQAIPTAPLPSIKKSCPTSLLGFLVPIRLK